MTNGTNQLEVLKTKRSGDRIVSFLVRRPSGSITVEKATAENILLYEHGMHELFNTDEETVLMDDPEIKIKPSLSSSSYTLTVNGETILTSPKHADDVMEGVKELVEYNDYNPIMDVWEDIIESQVDRRVVKEMFPHIGILDGERNRVEQTESGWLVDGYYLVDWAAEVYLVEDTGDTFIRGAGGVIEADKSHEFLAMRGGGNIESFDRTTINVDGTESIVGKKEVRFFSKVYWLLNRFDLLADRPFWLWMERRRESYLDGTLEEDFLI